jgi:hypothetical protein
MLDNLDSLPSDPTELCALLTSPTGFIVHEIGHVVAASFCGIPTDYLIIDEQKGHGRHATYTNERYAARLEASLPNRIRILTGGFSAERAIFGRISHNTAYADLESLAPLVGKQFDPNDLKPLTKHIERTTQCAFTFEETNLIRDTYKRVAAAIRSGAYLYESAQIIPFRFLDSSRYPFSFATRTTARVRTTIGFNREEILKTLRAGVASGIR